MAVTREAGYYKVTAAGDKIQGPIVVKRFRWVGATTAAHACVVKDGGGKELYSALANAANFINEKDGPSDVLDVVDVTTMASGVLEVHYR